MVDQTKILIEAFKSSGLTQKAYCIRHGIGLDTLKFLIHVSIHNGVTNEYPDAAKNSAALEKRIRRLAKKSNQNINKTAADFLAKGAGSESIPAQTKKRRDLSGIFPKWTEQDHIEFQNNTRIFDTIDETRWHA